MSHPPVRPPRSPVRRRLALLTTLAAGSLACGDAPAAPPPVAGVTIEAPRPVMLVDDTMTVRAVAHDANGRPLGGRAVSWRSAIPEVATVEDGRLVAHTPGDVLIVATVEGHEGHFVLDVDALPVATIVVVPSVVEFRAGDSASVDVRLLDRRGERVAHRTVEVHDEMATGATIDAAGWVRAPRGTVTSLRLTIDGVTAYLPLRVQEEPLTAIHPVQRRFLLAPDALVTPLHAIGRTRSGRSLTLAPITMSSSDPSVVTVIGGGVRPVASGDAELVVALDGIEARVPVTVAEPPTSAFDVDVRWTSAPPPWVERAFAEAIAGWRRTILGDLPDLRLALPDSACLDEAPAFDGAIDDLLLWVRVDSMDGPGGVLGAAGPCVVRRDGLPAVGVVMLDRDDVADQGSQGSSRLQRLAMHEIGHVLGIGTLWEEGVHVAAANTLDPRYRGTLGRRAVGDVGFTGAEADGIEIEAEGGDGTAGSHWRESIYRAELMTGWLEMMVGAPLSRFTIGALEDLGYEVWYGAAEPVAPPALPPAYLHVPTHPSGMPPSGRLTRAAPGERLRERVQRPRFELDASGRVRRR